MKKERLKVLEMVEEGKITVDEAAKLLENLALSSASPGQEAVDDMEERIHAFSRAVDAFAKDFGSRISETCKNCEPAFRNATKKVVEKTAVIMDDISKSLHESLNNMEANINDAQATDNQSDDQPREN